LRFAVFFLSFFLSLSVSGLTSHQISSQSRRAVCPPPISLNYRSFRLSAPQIRRFTTDKDDRPGIAPHLLSVFTPASLNPLKSTLKGKQQCGEIAIFAADLHIARELIGDALDVLLRTDHWELALTKGLEGDLVLREPSEQRHTLKSRFRTPGAAARGSR
jgi:hypothetical protein